MHFQIVRLEILTDLLQVDRLRVLERALNEVDNGVLHLLIELESPEPN